jgi:hypothetical protein
MDMTIRLFMAVFYGELAVSRNDASPISLRPSELTQADVSLPWSMCCQMPPPSE